MIKILITAVETAKALPTKTTANIVMYRQWQADNALWEKEWRNWAESTPYMTSPYAQLQSAGGQILTNQEFQVMNDAFTMGELQALPRTQAAAIYLSFAGHQFSESALHFAANLVHLGEGLIEEAIHPVATEEAVYQGVQNVVRNPGILVNDARALVGNVESGVSNWINEWETGDAIERVQFIGSAGFTALTLFGGAAASFIARELAVEGEVLNASTASTGSVLERGATRNLNTQFNFFRGGMPSQMRGGIGEIEGTEKSLQFELAPRVEAQLKDPRLGKLAGKLDINSLNKLASNPNAQFLYDSGTGNINVVQNVEGELLRITVPRDTFKIISVGPIQGRNIINSIINGRFIPIGQQFEEAFELDEYMMRIMS